MRLPLTLLLASIPGFGQDGSPLLTWDFSVKDSGTEQTVSFRVKNSGTKPIIGYVSFIRTNDGVTIIEVYKRHHVAFHRSAVYKPGAEWTEEFSLSSLRGAAGQALSVSKPEIDFVLFEDGSRWGPDQYRLASRIRGEIAGVTLEHARLSDLLKRKGVEAVVKDLSGNRFDQ